VSGEGWLFFPVPEGVILTPQGFFFIIPLRGYSHPQGYLFFFSPEGVILTPQGYLYLLPLRVTPPLQDRFIYIY
jgi:hypothetical protein